MRMLGDCLLFFVSVAEGWIPLNHAVPMKPMRWIWPCQWALALPTSLLWASWWLRRHAAHTAQCWVMQRGNTGHRGNVASPGWHEMYRENQSVWWSEALSQPAPTTWLTALLPDLGADLRKRGTLTLKERVPRALKWIVNYEASSSTAIARLSKDIDRCWAQRVQ